MLQRQDAQQAKAELTEPIIVGLISDTHDLLRPKALDALRGSHFIIHAGDIGGTAILEQLERIAPVTAVRGNTDIGWDLVDMPPETAVLEVGMVRIFVIHSNNRVGYPGFDVVVSGHTHLPEAVMKDGILYVNPGSAGPYRPYKPVSVGRLVITGKRIEPQLLALDV